MKTTEQFLSFMKRSGVDQFILVDKDAKIILNSMDNSAGIAKMVSDCSLIARSIGKKKFSRLTFLRDSQQDFSIFPVGKYYLGVIQQRSIDPAQLTENITRFLKDL